jgi:site-specific DNA-methyltransferase (adenine-specific)
MKANNGTGNIPERDEWETPQELWDELDKQYNFKFDCCANEKNRKTINYSSDFLNDNAVKNCVVWMNPPFSKAFEMFERFFDYCYSGIAIYRCDNMETIIWQDIILKKATWIAIPKGRINYEGFKGNGSRFPSALIGLKIDIPRLKDFTVLEICR